MRKYTVLETGYIQYEENGISYTIPSDEANSDYQAYLVYVANGNKAPDTLVSELTEPAPAEKPKK